MRKAHFIAFLVGTLFWGLAFSLVHASWRAFAGVPIAFWPTFGLYVAGTIVVSVVIQEMFGGFPVGEPFFWFFYPLGSWIIFLGGAGIQNLMMGQ